MSRPSVMIPQWATDLLYTAAGKAWDMAVTKIQPALSKIAMGWEPDEMPPPEFLNWILNALGLHLAHLDAVEVQNWSELGSVSGVPVQSRGYTSVWDPINRRLWVGGTQVMFSYNGISWTDAAVVFSELNGLDVNPNTGLVAGVTQTTTPARAYYQADPNPGVWAFKQLVNGGNMQGVKYDPTLDVFFFYGATSAGTPRPGVWRGTATMSAATQDTVTGVATGTMDLLAVSPAIKVAMGGSMYYTTASTSWNEEGPVNISLGGPFAAVPANLIWDASRQVFVVTCDDGWIYSSADGVVWAEIRGFDPELIFTANTLAVNGGLYVAISGDGLTIPFEIRYSVDGGLTWPRVAYPLGQGDIPVGLSLVDDRFQIMATSGSAVFSLRLK